MKRFFLLVCYLTIYTSAAQTITILDADSKFSISNVAIFNEDKSKRVVSDKKGLVNISEFTNDEILTFMHISYIEHEALKRQLLDSKIVYLRSAAHQLEEVFLSTSKSSESRSRIAEQIDVFSIQEIQKYFTPNVSRYTSRNTRY